MAQLPHVVVSALQGPPPRASMVASPREPEEVSHHAHVIWDFLISEAPSSKTGDVALRLRINIFITAFI